MSIRTLTDRDDGKTVMYDSTTGMAFGPVFETDEDAEDFLVFALQKGHADVRRMKPVDFLGLVKEWHKRQAS
jgi:hypothetical protein